MHLLLLILKEKIKQKIEINIDINNCDYDGRTPLHIAAAFGNYTLVELLLNNG